MLSNFIPHQTITIDDKDPPWFHTKIKSLLQEKNKTYTNFRKDRNNTQLLRTGTSTEPFEQFNLFF